MRTIPFTDLPYPLALAVYNYQMETPVQSADELARLITALVEYLAVVALMEYFDGHPDPTHNGHNENLNGWVLTQLIFGKVEAGLWARWTQIAILHTKDTRFPCLQSYIKMSNLDDAQSHLSRLLRFRNDVMHGGFVAPLPKIQAADVLLTELFSVLQPLWEHPVLACIDETENHWIRCTGLQSTHTSAPMLTRSTWSGVGSIVLMDSNQEAVLALHPGCIIDPKSQELNYQHHWKHVYQGWVDRTPTLKAFYERYQKERSGWFDDTHWRQHLEENRPEFGLLPRKLDHELETALESRVSILISGAPMEGKSTFVKHNLERLKRAFVVFHIEDNSLQMDPNILFRWIQSSSASHCESTVLVIDNIHRLGQGIYSNESCQQVFDLMREIPQSIISIAPIQSKLTTSFDRELRLKPWTISELSSEAIREKHSQHAGYALLLANPNEGWTRFNALMKQMTATHPLAHLSMLGLLDHPRSLLELAEHIQTFTPKVEHTLAQLKDWVQLRNATDSQEDQFTLHPAAALWLHHTAEVGHES